jgi:hypothetical protein
MRRFWACLAVAFLCAAAAPGQSLLNPQWGTIFQPVQALQLAHQCSRAAPSPITAVWLPTPAQIAALEPRLSALLSSQLATYSKDRFSAADYYRQYGGLVVGGKQIIYVNGFNRRLLASDGANWLTRAVLICDGGIIAFGVEYDPGTGSFSHFAFNGHL